MKLPQGQEENKRVRETFGARSSFFTKWCIRSSGLCPTKDLHSNSFKAGYLVKLSQNLKKTKDRLAAYEMGETVYKVKSNDC